jgi:hypothetical protein
MKEVRRDSSESETEEDSKRQFEIQKSESKVKRRESHLMLGT